MNRSAWPDLRYEDWKDTCQTLHRWAQIVGKVRLAKSPWLNHSWHATLYVTERGLTTSVIHDDRGAFSLVLDFLDHALVVRRSDGALASLPLRSEPVSSFHHRCLGMLRELGIEATISGVPNEVADATPFAEDHEHRTYDREYANRFWRVLLQCDRILKRFRSRFVGKASPVHFFWGSFDIAVTRFSGRTAPEHPGGVPHLPDIVAREAYSHEVSSAGFWPGDERFPAAAFYSYAYPQPPGFESAKMVEGAFYDDTLNEFLLPYDAVKDAEFPERTILEFLQCTYDAAATLGDWNREPLEESPHLRALQAQADLRRLGRKAA